MRILFCLAVIILLSFISIKAQSISSLETGSIVELECEQSAVTNTFVAVSMERNNQNPADQRIVIHRSDNYGTTWTLIDSVVTNSDDYTMADPVIASDDNGTFYLVLMRVLSIEPYTIHLEFYRSEDDGLNWEYINSPYNQELGADYPQIISRGDGELYMVYSLYTLTYNPYNFYSEVQFQKSIDGGNTWSEAESFPTINTDSIATIGPDLSFGYDGKINVSYGGYNDKVYSLSSVDDGDSWSDIMVSSNVQSDGNNIVKPVSNDNYENWGVISHMPHRYATPISFHAFKNDEWNTTYVDLGAYGQGYMDGNGIIHIVYNHIAENEFQIKYTFSNDGGDTFSESIVLYSNTFDTGHEGEYQSLIVGDDGTFYITFCDWADASRAKFLIFNPGVTSTSDLGNVDFSIFPNPTSDVVNIKWDDNLQVKKVHILDVNGNMVKLLDNDLSQNVQIIDVTDLPTGNYIIMVSDENRFLVKMMSKI